MHPVATAVILCGGKSTRAGFDKQLLPCEGTTLPLSIARRLATLFPEIIIVTSTPERYADSPCVVVQDIVKGAGPLAGILTGLMHASSDYAYVIAGDMPNLELPFIQWMAGLPARRPVDAVAVRTGRDHLEPFNSIFAARCAAPMRAALDRGERGVCRFLRGCGRAELVPEEVARRFSPDWSMFESINTRTDVERYLACRQAPHAGLPSAAHQTVHPPSTMRICPVM